ncbi:hypothetical protein [Jejubacter sp. L23]
MKPASSVAEKIERIARRLSRAIDASPQIPTGVSIGISCIEHGWR